MHDTLKNKNKISFNTKEQKIYDIIQQLVYFCNDIDIIYNFLNEQINKDSPFRFENIINILDVKDVL